MQLEETMLLTFALYLYFTVSQFDEATTGAGIFALSFVHAINNIQNKTNMYRLMLEWKFLFFFITQI
jgi:hypothetical protein